jgi:hypothetical protein
MEKATKLVSSTKLILGSLSLMIMFCVSGFSQDISETNISFMDGKQNAIEATYNFSEDVMETVVKNVLEKKSIKKTKNTKGYSLYEGAIFGELSSDKIDFYIKVDGNKTSTKIIILISKGYNNFVSESSDPSTVKNVKKLCKEFNVNAIEEHLNREITKQEEVIKDAEKKYNKSVSKGKDLLKDKEDIIKKIGENSEEQKTMKANIEEQNKILGTLKSKK